jgi:iron(III) transport system permease protein
LIFGAPSRIEFFATFLYDEGLNRPRPNYGFLAAGAIVMLLVTGVLIAIQLKLLGDARRFVAVSGKASQPRKFKLGKFRWPAFAVMAIYVIAAVLIPVAGVALRSITKVLTPLIPIRKVLTLENWRHVWDTPVLKSSITTSLKIALFGAIVATLVIALICVVGQRSNFRFRKGLDYAAMAPRAFPAITISMGFFWAMFFFPPLGALRNSYWILVIAYTVRFLPAGLGAYAPLLMRYDRSLDNAARVAGADWWTVCRRILLRLSAVGLVGTYVILFASFIREYATGVYLVAPGTQIMGTTMLQLWSQGTVGSVAVLAMVQLIVSCVLAAASRRAIGGVAGNA